ncbi:PWWP domain-containing DNA repair factor 3B [Aplochiton taeniatus]
MIPPNPPRTHTHTDTANPSESTLSSDLSIELSLLEEHPGSLSIQEEEENEEDVEEEELPSFFKQMEKKPLSITEGICVWCKFRNYPFWPAVVKSVNRKMRKASVVFIDDQLFDKKSIRKGISVALKTLKPFDCADAHQLVCKARETYDAAIKWCMELIADYRIRVGCGSFTGSIIEYVADDISCPVRRKYPQGSSELTFPSQLMMEDQSVLCDNESSSEQQQQDEEARCSKKLLPDRSKAARYRANKKLVHFIVKQRMAEKHLLLVISGQQPSQWVRSFLRASKKVVDTYLEDEEQVDQVYKYLEEVYKKAPSIAPSLANVDLIRFNLDVLLPEAVICAIAGVDNVSMAKAKDKYLKGPSVSKREKEWFDQMIEKQTWKKADCQKLGY